MPDRTRIDAYSHVMTEAVLDALAGATSSRRVEDYRGRLDRFDVDRRLDLMERYGVDRQVITLTGFRIWRGGDPEGLLPATRAGNDEVRRLADEHPDAFVPVGTVQFLTDGYVEEARRCLEDLDMAGLQIYTNVEGTPIDDDAFRPFYEVVDDADVPIWLHPQNNEGYDVETDDWLFTMLGWPFETSYAVGRLIFGGVMDRFPNLRVVTHHLGGTLPYLGERLRSWHRMRSSVDHLADQNRDPQLAEPLDAYLDRIYADTAVSSLGENYTLETGLAFFGRENVLFGTDFPYGPERGEYWLRRTIPTIEGLDVSERTKRMICSANAEALLG